MGVGYYKFYKKFQENHMILVTKLRDLFFDVLKSPIRITQFIITTPFKFFLWSTLVTIKNVFYDINPPLSDKVKDIMQNDVIKGLLKGFYREESTDKLNIF